MAGGNDSQMLGYAQGVTQYLSAIAKTLSQSLSLTASRGTFTMAAAASKSVTDTACKGTSVVTLTPTNAAAGTLLGSAKCLYVTAANGSFTVTTASGASAAGTETFAYMIGNSG